MVLITGPAKNCTEARVSLEKRVQQLETEKEDRVSINFFPSTCCLYFLHVYWLFLTPVPFKSNYIITAVVTQS